MTSFDSDIPEAFHCVAWNSHDDVASAHFKYFDDRAESREFAGTLQDRGVPYIWRAQRGRYQNYGGKSVEDWIYYWWIGDHLEAGVVPDTGYGVPDHKNWSYVTEYVPLDPGNSN